MRYINQLSTKHSHWHETWNTHLQCWMGLHVVIAWYAAVLTLEFFVWKQRYNRQLVCREELGFCRPIKTRPEVRSWQSLTRCTDQLRYLHQHSWCLCSCLEFRRLPGAAACRVHDALHLRHVLKIGRELARFGLARFQITSESRVSWCHLFSYCKDFYFSSFRSLQQMHSKPKVVNID